MCHKALSSWLLALAIFCMLGSVQAAPPTAPVVRPVNLTCEYLVNPLGIDAARPRFSWQMDDSRRGARQTAFEILVSADEGSLASGRGELWDSGRVDSDQSVQVQYGGKPLVSQTRCFWKVRVWDKDGNRSSWSEPAMFSMGLLRAADWTARWIGSPTAAEYAAKHKAEEPSPLFRKTFTVSKAVKRAMVYVSGLGYYELSLNGQRVGDRVLDPGFTRYDRRVLYATYDVTGQIAQGRNALGVGLGNGWYNFQTKAAWDFNQAPWRDKPKLLLQLVVEYADGSRETIASDATWKFATGPVLFDCLLNGETYDARLDKSGGDEADYDDSAWPAAKLVTPPAGVLSAQQSPPMREMETLVPIRLSEPKPGVFVYDLGQNIAGVVRLKVRGPAGTTVTLRYGERLRADGTVDQDAIRIHTKQGDFQTDRYTLDGQSNEVYQPHFVYHGFQYVEVTGFPGKPTLDNLRGIVLHTALASAGGFECSNSLLNRIQAAMRRSYVSNFHDHPTDCPHREKNGWTGDAHLAAQAGLFNYAAASSYTKWMRDFRDEQRQSGELPAILPTGGWGYAWGNGPAWDSAFLLIPWYLYEYCGDQQVLAENYEGFKRYVDYLSGKSNQGIVSIGLGDWLPAKSETPAEITSTAYYYVDAVLLARIARILGKNEDAARYETLAKEIHKAFGRSFVDVKTGQVGKGTQTALSCALYQDLLDPADRARVAANLVANVEQHGGHVDCGILGTKYLLHALSDTGRADLAYTVATQTTFPSWGRWMEQGATTLWEQWNGDDSRNHVMFGDISAWFYATLAGIQPDGPGFKRILIDPHPVGDLSWVKAYHDSPYGRITSNWKRFAGRLILEVVIPANTTATVRLPTKDADGVLVGGQAVDRAEGVKFLRSEPAVAVYEVTAGAYDFTCALPSP